jgi:DNA-binding NarL/FixJ family response regulator
MDRINLLIVDDRKPFRQVLRRLLECREDIRVVEDVGGGAEAARAVRTHRVDVVVLELLLPGPLGLELIRDLKAQQPSLKILFLSRHSQLSEVARALAAGASGLLAMGGIFDELVSAIHHVANGERYICPNLAHQLALRGIHSDGRRPPLRSAYTLTP